jgi:hypothetical protein
MSWRLTRIFRQAMESRSVVINLIFFSCFEIFFLHRGAWPVDMDRSGTTSRFIAYETRCRD